MYHLYHFVDSCPKCESARTGRLVYGSVVQDWLVRKFLRRGELIDFTTTTEYNCFCADCGAKWYGDIPLILLNGEEFAEEKELRGIEAAKEASQKYFEKMQINYGVEKKERKRRKNEDKKERKRKARKLWL